MTRLLRRLFPTPDERYARFLAANAHHGCGCRGKQVTQ